MWRILGFLVLAALLLRYSMTEGFMDNETGGAKHDPNWNAETLWRPRMDRGVNLLVATPPNAMAWAREALPAAYEPPKGNLVEQEI